MTGTQINKEIKETKAKMDLLFACVNDPEVSKEDRKEYHSAYVSASVYYLKLNQAKPSHDLTIA